MNPQSRDTVTFLLSSAIASSVLLGLAIRYVLMPYLRDHLVQPIRDTHKAVTENHHANEETPTLPDRLEDLHTDVRTLTRLLDLHVSWSLGEHAAIDAELARLRKHRKNGAHE